ncbi:ATP-grasp domain-containing protein [Bradyrhizobium sp. KB893862 SZCCT0404]|uniref:ATP-grasp domain-containing protein n=1 Tax=Bradyrhizobium sp. KB893862 SZCCT0404 TaxID=2807672 RepID=UPI001BABBD5F|nr:ATP-grasp domain-containing protein [Bradyrhizobium sp. KB893862 SZCCT0404]MBR1174234.1 ATP-grasp domain-containing protein [Bradyrhizobium sp. KB893862 SZCCT0404]
MIYETTLITGCAGDIALALARIARDAGAVHRLIGCDIHADHAGPAFFDVCELVPRANDVAYLETLDRIVKTYRVDVIVPMSEAEITVLLAGGHLGAFAGVPVLTANRLAVETGLDKYATFNRLAAHKLGVPWTCIVGEAQPLALPCILKRRRGQGGKDLRLINTDEEVEIATRTRPGDLWQELLLPEDQEYTCGLYRSRTGETRTIVLRRRLQGGLTGAAVVVDSAPFSPLLHGIADALDLNGSINVQLRLTANGPKVFEINPRFSSTVGFRHRLGFHDFIWSLLDSRELAIGAYRAPSPGIRMYRCADEVIIG